MWERNFNHVEQLFDYGSDIRRIIYTTNAVESVHSSFRKVTKKGAFPNENSLLKLLYSRTQELHTKWNGGTIRNWSMVLNQLSINLIKEVSSFCKEETVDFIRKYQSSIDSKVLLLNKVKSIFTIIMQSI